MPMQPAFSDAARETQAVFRIVMNALARPGRIQNFDPPFAAPAPLFPAAAAIMLTLADYETPIWLDAMLAGRPAVIDFLRFHTGAKITDDPKSANFAFIADIADAPPLGAFAQGLPAYPDRSTTLILQVEALTSRGWVLTGPGIDGEQGFGVSPLPAGFAQQLQDNRARFPLGVDLIFIAPDAIAALPRSTRLAETL